MLVRATRFNIYYFAAALALIAGIVCGCQSPEKKAKKKPSLLRIHLEASADVPNRSQAVTVFRNAPTVINVEPRPFLTEEFVKTATVYDTMGGFALKIEFNREGRLLLEQYTSGNKTRRLVIFSHFIDPSDPKVEVDRWLGAPRVAQAITDGMLVFAPDASREEAERVALGLRNISKKLGTAKEL